MSDQAIGMVQMGTNPDPQSLPWPTQRPERLTLPAAAQVLPAATARALSLTEGRHRPGLFLLVCALFGVIVPVEIAADSQMFVSRTIMGVPPHYALTAFVVALAVLVDLRYLQRVCARPSVALGFVCIAILLAEGVLRYGMRSYLVRSDVYIMRWFFVGFILMRLATAAGMLRPYLVFVKFVARDQLRHHHDRTTSERRLAEVVALRGFWFGRVRPAHLHRFDSHVNKVLVRRSSALPGGGLDCPVA